MKNRGFVLTAGLMVLKTLLLAIIFTIANMAAIFLTPFSESFRQLPAGPAAISIISLLVLGFWYAIVLGLAVSKTRWGGIKTSLCLILILWTTAYGLTQVETIIFRESLTAISVYDALMLMVSGFFTLAVFIPAGVALHGGFSRQYNPLQDERKRLTNRAVKFGVLAVLYVLVYFAFGHFVAWQFADLRLFYSGTTENRGLLYQISTSLHLIPLQLLRGLVFVLAADGLRYVMNKDKAAYITAVTMLFMSSGVMLLAPNPIFPDAVRIGHMLELLSSMMVFGLITGFIMDASPRQDIIKLSMR